MTATVDSCTLRHRRRRCPYARRRQLHIAAPPPTVSLCTLQTAAHCGTATANIHTYVADGCTSRGRRRRRPYGRRRRLHFAAVPLTTSMRTLQMAAHCGGAADGVSMRVADGCTSRQYRRQRPYARRRRLHTAAAPPAASIRTSQMAALRGGTADNVHTGVADGCTLRQRRQRRPRTAAFQRRRQRSSRTTATAALRHERRRVQRVRTRNGRGRRSSRSHGRGTTNRRLR